MFKPFQFILAPKSLQDGSNIDALKNRLDWGEPALTIIDVRDQKAFNSSHIMGAIAIPLSELVVRARSSLELIRDIYVYGETDEQTSTAAAYLREAGYQYIAELTGGLKAWKLAEYPTEEILATGV